MKDGKKRWINKIIYTYLKYLSHPSLLALRAVIFNGENYRVGWANKGTPIYRFHYWAKRNFCSEGMTMINEWRTVVSIPAVQFHAPTSSLKNLQIVIAFRYVNHFEPLEKNFSHFCVAFAKRKFLFDFYNRRLNYWISGIKIFLSVRMDHAFQFLKYLNVFFFAFNKQ